MITVKESEFRARTILRKAYKRFHSPPIELLVLSLDHTTSDDEQQPLVVIKAVNYQPETRFSDIVEDGNNVKTVVG